MRNRVKLSFIVSYATRPMRVNETNGIEHIFISNEEADKLLEDKENIIAYTEIGDIRYFTNTECFNKGDNVYIIDPNGIKYMKEHLKNKSIKVIYIYASDEVRERRAASRQDKLDVYKERIKSEDAQFTEFEANHHNYDLFVNNRDEDLHYSVDRIIDFIRRTFSNDTLYCIVGRTCSGKDTLMKNVFELVNR